MEASSLEDIIHDHPMYLSVAVQYVRPKHAVYIRGTFQGVVRDVVESDDLDLEVDPSKVSEPKYKHGPISHCRARSTDNASPSRRRRLE